MSKKGFHNNAILCAVHKPILSLPPSVDWWEQMEINNCIFLIDNENHIFSLEGIEGESGYRVVMDRVAVIPAKYAAPFISMSRIVFAAKRLIRKLRWVKGKEAGS